MAGELNTEVKDDPDGVRTLVDWLGKTQPQVSEIGDAVHKQRSASEGFWQGTAATACRGELTNQGHDSDTAEQQIGKVKDALHTFAGAIDTVKSRMNQARSVATGAGLTVTPTAILPPEPVPAGPAPLPQGPVSPEVQSQHDAATRAHGHAMANHRAQQKAFDEASDTVDQARTQQADAHTALQESMQDPLGALKNTKSAAVYATSAGLSYIKGAHGAIEELTNKAESLDDTAKTMQTRAMSSPSPNFKGLWERASTRAADRGSKAWAGAATTEKSISKVGPGARTIISANPSGLVKGSSAVAKVGKGFLRGVPFVGSAVTITSGVGDWMMGKNPGKAAADTGANLAGGSAGGWAGAAIGTAICPGVGTAVGGVVGGIAGSLGATSALDSLMD